MARKTIKVDYLARVEGEGAFKVVVRDGKVKSAELSIFEPPRFFEAFLRGRAFTEAPDFTARICGICPVAYQMSAVHAMENALGVTVGGPLRELRRLLYCGEWIESHTLHVHLLHAPDFLGYEGSIDMARDHGDAVKRGLQVKKAGNDIVNFIGGREIHPINVCVGGFYRVPKKREFTELAEKLKWGRDAAREVVRWVSGLDFPERERDYIFVSLRHPDEYPFSEGHIVSNRGLDIPVSEYDAHFEEMHVEHSTALQSRMKPSGEAYLVGPLARYALNFDKLSPLAQEAAKEAGLGTVCKNPYKSIVVRAVETLYAFDEALRIIENYEEPDRPAVPLKPRAATGYGATEAPRGLLYHRYRLEADGTIATAQIVPPTSQNQASVEEDLTNFVEGFLDLPDKELQHRCEQTVRNYDPCISCATHFLKLDIDRG
jgi:coenzyme F420-reducing hydrogenase alpha subunit